MTTTPPSQIVPAKRVRRHIMRRLVRAALFATVRGLAYAVGTTSVSLIIWWISNR